MLEFLRGTDEERFAQTRYSELKRKTSLSKKEKTEFRNVEGLARRLALKRITVTGSTVVVAGIVGVTAWETTKTEQDPLFTVKNAETFGKKKTEEILKAANLWNQKHHCGRTVVIQPLDREYDFGGGQYAASNSTPGIINTYPYQNDITDEILHEMTHACVPDEVFYPQTPIETKPGVKIISWHGLKITVQVNGQTNEIDFVEEAMAERNAKVINPGYSASSLIYRELGNLAFAIFPDDKFPEAGSWGSKNDFPALVRAFNNLSTEAPITAQNIVIVMDTFNEAWNKGAREISK